MWFNDIFFFFNVSQWCITRLSISVQPWTWLMECVRYLFSRRSKYHSIIWKSGVHNRSLVLSCSYLWYVECRPFHASIMNVDNRRGLPLLWYRKTNGRAKRHFCFSGTDEVIVGEEMEISLNKLYIWNQQTTGNPMLVFLSRVSLVFINWQIFILHFHYDNFSLTETFSLQNVRSPRGNRFPKRKRKLDKMLRSYAWFLQSVSMI